MPRVKPHAKIHASLGNHRKTASMFQDNDLFALYCRLLIVAIERFADRTEDTFTIRVSEIASLAGKDRSDSGKRLLQKLASTSPVVIHYLGDTCQVTIPNFAKKQGFGPRNGRGMESPPTPTPTPTPTNSTHTGPSQMTLDESGGKPSSKPKSPKAGSEAWAKTGAIDIWPELVKRAASHGKSWSATPQKNQLAKVAARIREGATRAQLLDAIDGFAALHGDRLDSGDQPMRRFFRATTIYQPTKFEEYLEAANDASAPDAREAEKAKREEDLLERINNYREDE